MDPRLKQMIDDLTAAAMKDLSEGKFFPSILLIGTLRNHILPIYIPRSEEFFRDDASKEAMRPGVAYIWNLCQKHNRLDKLLAVVVFADAYFQTKPLGEMPPEMEGDDPHYPEGYLRPSQDPESKEALIVATSMADSYTTSTHTYVTVNGKMEFTYDKGMSESTSFTGRLYNLFPPSAK